MLPQPKKLEGYGHYIKGNTVVYYNQTESFHLREIISGKQRAIYFVYEEGGRVDEMDVGYVLENAGWRLDYYPDIDGMEDYMDVLEPMIGYYKQRLKRISDRNRSLGSKRRKGR